MRSTDEKLKAASFLSRRQFVYVAGAGVAATTFASAKGWTAGTALRTSRPEDLVFLSATRLAKLIVTKEVSSEEIVKAFLSQIQKVNTKLNAVVEITAQRALSQAREADSALARGQLKGPLHGVPMTVKDSINTAGVVTTHATLGCKGQIPKFDGTVVSRMKQAGAIMLGKTNLPELALAAETDNLVYGRTNNPYRLDRNPGGSSGGEAAIIAAGGSPIGLGSDAGGSIRLPAHYCGIAGLKPTSGRVPLTGHSPESRGGGGGSSFIMDFATIGPMARFVEDLGLALGVIAGMDWYDPLVVPMPLEDYKTVDVSKLRVAFYCDNGILSPAPEVAETVRATVRSVGTSVPLLEEKRPPALPQARELFWGLLSADGGMFIRKHLEGLGTKQISPLVEKMLAQLAKCQKSQLETSALVAWRYGFRSSMLTFMKDFDAIICPPSAYAAPLHGTTFDPDKLEGFSYTYPYNITGWPGVVVRAGTSPEGLPIGVQVVAAPWREHIALALAEEIEKKMGGWKKPLDC